MRRGTARRTARRGPAMFAASAAAVLAACSTGAATPPVEHPEWAAVFDELGVGGTFAAQRIEPPDDELHVVDVDAAERRSLPASTFKILNSLIILETGTVDDVDTVIEWDGTDRGVPAWNRDHTLRSGIEVSAVWMFQELARLVGEDRMAEWVTASDYGNADVGGGIDRFWLDGDLRISPVEQVDFVGRLFRDELPFEREHLAAVREILVRETGPDWTWSHKTGTALRVRPQLGWLVGATEWRDVTWAFALRIELAGAAAVTQIEPELRLRLARRLLADLGALP